VECFPLVQQQHVTACLSLSDLNDRGVVAACEGDLTSMVGMMIGKAITGMVPWMANVAAIDNNAVLLAHCTAPTNLLSGFTIDTHYETGEGTAIKGMFRGDEVTVFRLGSTLENIFLSLGHVMERPQNSWACRTQIRVEMPEEAIVSLKNSPLGNHHLVLPGNQYDTLKKASEILNLEEI
jgi:L-fucose isomerase-like protein